MFNFDVDQFMQIETDETLPEIEVFEFNEQEYLNQLDETF